MSASVSGDSSTSVAGGHDLVVEAMVQLMRLALDVERTVAEAASELRGLVPHESALRRAQANLSKVMATSANWVLDRAAAIVHMAVNHRYTESNEIDHVGSCGWPYASACPRCFPDL